MDLERLPCPHFVESGPHTVLCRVGLVARVSAFDSVNPDKRVGIRETGLPRVVTIFRLL